MVPDARKMLIWHSFSFAHLRCKKSFSFYSAPSTFTWGGGYHPISKIPRSAPVIFLSCPLVLGTIYVSMYTCQMQPNSTIVTEYCQHPSFSTNMYKDTQKRTYVRTYTYKRMYVHAYLHTHTHTRACRYGRVTEQVNVVINHNRNGR